MISAQSTRMLWCTYIWVDDVRPMPDYTSAYEYRYAVKAVDEFITTFLRLIEEGHTDFIIDLDHDAGDYAPYGGDYIKIVEWLIENGYNTDNVHLVFHTMNPVGRENMEALYNRYWGN